MGSAPGGREVWQTAGCARAMLLARLAACSAEGRILLALGHGPRLAGDLAAGIRVELSQVSRAVGRLAAEELVDLEPRGRNVLCSLTERVSIGIEGSRVTMRLELGGPCFCAVTLEFDAAAGPGAFVTAFHEPRPKWSRREPQVDAEALLAEIEPLRPRPRGGVPGRARASTPPRRASGPGSA